MSKHSEYLLQKLEMTWPHGTVATSPWLKSLGISRSLMNRFKKSGWVESIGYGAFSRLGANIDWSGGLSSMQFQLGMDIHVGGKTALEMHGHAHYLSLGQTNIDIFKTKRTKLPKWFLNHEWEERVRYVDYNFLPPNLGIVEKDMGNYKIRISSRERAALELLQLAPRLYAFDEIVILMEALGSLRRDVLNNLLAHCTSNKAKRLMLYFGDNQKHSWYKDLDHNELSIGNTVLKIVPLGGRYIAKYKLSIPKDYVINDDAEIRF